MTHLDRRRFLRLNAAALAGAALVPGAAAARSPARDAAARAPRRPPPGFYRFGLGDLEVTVLNDGHFALPTEIFAIDVDPEISEAYYRSRLVPLDTHPLEASPVVLDTGSRRLLVDSGSGAFPAAPPTGGRLAAGLDAAGIPPESIDVVVLTHAHPDHLGGLLHAQNGGPFFANAEVLLSDVELEYWSDDGLADRAPEWMSGLVPGIQQTLRGVNGRLRTVREGEEVAPGIRTVASPGHTPGHIALAAESGGRQLLLVGDAIVTTHQHFEHPEWQFLFDLDPEGAGRTRRRLLDRAAADEVLILGYHFPFPGLGHALRYGDAFRWHPAGWSVFT